MPNDNQPAKSYIETVLARADGATKGPWTAHFDGCGIGMGVNHYAHRVRIGIHEYTVAHSEVITGDVEHTGRSQTLVNPTNAKPTLEPDAAFIAASRQDIPTLGEIALTMIEVLKAMADGTVSEWECKQVAQHTLVRINALATKGSQ